MTTHLPSSIAGLAAVRYRLGGPDITEGGAWWCSYGTRHGINENCDCAPTNILAVVFPANGAPSRDYATCRPNDPPGVAHPHRMCFHAHDFNSRSVA